MNTAIKTYRTRRIQAAADLLATPLGGWAETMEAERRLADELPAPWAASPAAIATARRRALRAALEAGATAHPDRR